jgi:hypothetical protein
LFFGVVIYHFGGWMKDGHVLQNGGTIVGDDNLTTTCLNL